MIITPEVQEFDEINLSDADLRDAINLLTSTQKAQAHRAQFLAARETHKSPPPSWPGIIYSLWPNVSVDEDQLVTSPGNDIEMETADAARLLLQNFAKKISDATLSSSGLRYNLHLQYDCQGCPIQDLIDLPHCDEANFVISVLTPNRKPFNQLCGVIEVEDQAVPHGLWARNMSTVNSVGGPLHVPSTGEVSFYRPSKAIIDACERALNSGAAKIAPMKCGALYNVGNKTPHFRGGFVEEGWRVILRTDLY